MSWFGNKNNNTAVGTTQAHAQIMAQSSVSTMGGGGCGGGGGAPSPHSTYTIASGIGVFAGIQPTNILSLRGKDNTEIVRLNVDGTVTWSQEINIDEAAEALTRTLVLGAELSTGITRKVKAEMRDTVFEEIIELAKLKGTLTLDDLTFMYEASKIMEKLKGGRE